MTINRLFFLLILSASIIIGGCGTFAVISNTGSDEIRMQERNFAGALQYLRAGAEPEAFDLFELVIAGPRVSGVTDEALFRLALLQLRDNRIKSVLRAEKLLERLRKEYPKSIWRHQAEPLVAYLESSGELRKNQRELKNLRESNVSLTRNNRELRQTIERLKELDIELEQKIRR